jgi:uncharacterized ion transporter superfamily protein YfcC
MPASAASVRRKSIVGGSEYIFSRLLLLTLSDLVYPNRYNRKLGNSPILSSAKEAEKEASQMGKDLKSEAKSITSDIKKKF